MATKLQMDRLNYFTHPEYYPKAIKRETWTKSCHHLVQRLWGILYRLFGVSRLSQGTLQSLRKRTIHLLTDQQIRSNLNRLKAKQLYQLNLNQLKTAPLEDRNEWLTKIAFPAVVFLLGKTEWKWVDALSPAQKMALLFYAHIHNMEALKTTLTEALKQLDLTEQNRLMCLLLDEVAYPTHDDEWEKIQAEILTIFWEKCAPGQNQFHSFDVYRKAACVRFAFLSGNSVETMLMLAKQEDMGPLFEHATTYRFTYETCAFLAKEYPEPMMTLRLSPEQKKSLLLYKAYDTYVKPEEVEYWLQHASKDTAAALSQRLQLLTDLPDLWKDPHKKMVDQMQHRLTVLQRI